MAAEFPETPTPTRLRLRRTGNARIVDQAKPQRNREVYGHSGGELTPGSFNDEPRQYTPPAFPGC